MRKKRSPGNPFYNCASWLAVRKQVLIRDGYRCQLRGPLCKGTADRVDHWVPRSKGGSDHPSNLVAACNPCNSSKKDVMAKPVVTVNW